MNQEGKDDQIKQWLLICASIKGSVLIIVAAMKLYWFYLQK